MGVHISQTEIRSNTENRIKKMVHKARRRGLITPSSVAFEKYSPSKEHHEGKIRNIIGQKCYDCIISESAPSMCSECALSGSLEKLSPYCKAIAREEINSV